MLQYGIRSDHQFLTFTQSQRFRAAGCAWIRMKVDRLPQYIAVDLPVMGTDTTVVQTLCPTLNLDLVRALVPRSNYHEWARALRSWAVPKRNREQGGELRRMEDRSEKVVSNPALRRELRELLVRSPVQPELAGPARCLAVPMVPTTHWRPDRAT